MTGEMVKFFGKLLDEIFARFVFIVGTGTQSKNTSTILNYKI